MSDDPITPVAAACLGCGYALRDLPEARCPECGRVFDPAVWSTMYVPAAAAAARQARAQSIVAVITWGLTTVFAAVAFAMFAAVVRPNTGTVMVAVVGGFYVGARVRRVADPPRSGRRPWRRRAWAVLFVLAALTGSDYYRCVHGTMAGLFGVGLAHSENGGPCHNGVLRNTSRRLSGDWYVWWVG